MFVIVKDERAVIVYDRELDRLQKHPIHYEFGGKSDIVLPHNF